MKKIIFILTMLMSGLHTQYVLAQAPGKIKTKPGATKVQYMGKADTQRVQSEIFPKGNKVDSENFTGDVWVSMLLPTDTTYYTQIGSVTFAPGARSNWHRHPSGQILLITDGLGYYQEKGKSIQLIRKGDVVKCPPGGIHWHGASPDQSLTHIALSPRMDKGSVVWLEKVTDEQYRKLE